MQVDRYHGSIIQQDEWSHFEWGGCLIHLVAKRFVVLQKQYFERKKKRNNIHFLRAIMQSL